MAPARHSRRDQLSLGYALARSGAVSGAVLPPGVSVRNHPDFRYFDHAVCRRMIAPEFLRAAVAAPG